VSGENAVSVEGVVAEVLANGTYWVDLANGHRFLGYVTRRDKPPGGRFAVGEKVRCTLWLSDLSKGRIAATTN
jgi:translation initiation factor IF-1